MSEKKPDKFSSLREKAKQLLKEKKLPEINSSEDISGIIEELNIHQIELEMQNEELHRSEEEVEKSRAKYAEWYDLAPVGYFTLNHNGIIKEVNLTGAAMFGIVRSVMIDTPFIQFLSDGNRKAFLKYLRDVISSKKITSFEIELIKKNKFRSFAQLISSPDEEGMLIKTVVTDITELRNTEDSLRKEILSRKNSEMLLSNTNRLLEEIFATAQFYIAYLDTKFNFVRVNKAFAELSGFKPEYFVGKNYFDLFPDEEKKSIFKSVIKSGNRYNAFEEPFINSGKGTQYRDWTLSPTFNNENKVNGVLLTLINVTHKVIAKKELEISERKHRELVYELPLCVIEFDEQGNIVFANPHFESTFGYSIDNPGKKANAFDLFLPEERKKFSEMILSLAKDNIHHAYSEYTMLTKNGESLYVMAHFCSLKNNHYDNLFRGILIDITEHKKRDNELRKSEELLKKAQRVAKLGIWEYNIRENEIKISEEVYDIFESVPNTEKLRFENFLENVHNDDRTFIESTVREALSGKEHGNIIHRIITDKGEERIINEIWDSEFDENGKTVVLKGTVQDITELKKTEQMLIEEQAKLNQLVKYKTFIAGFASRLSNTENIMKEINDSLVQISDNLKIDKVCIWRMEKKAKEKVELFLHETNGCKFKLDENPAYIPSVRKKLLNDQPFIISNRNGLSKTEKGFFEKYEINSIAIFPLKVTTVEGFLCMCKPGEYLWSEDEISFFHTIADMISSAWKRQHDLQELVKTEEKLTEAIQLAERASRLASIGEIAGGITHEINQPLNAIKVTTDSILFWYKNNQGVVPKKFMTMLGNISDCTDRISAIISHMKAFWSSPGESANEVVDMNDSIKHALSLVDRQLRVHGIDLQIELSEQELKVELNKINLEQIIINLVNNAMNALDNVDKFEKTINISTSRERNWAVLKIEDNGTGLPEEIGEKIFDPFFTTRSPGEGSGLGLSIVKRLVDSRYGKISFYNNKMGGATFMIKFPLIPEIKDIDE